MLAEEGVEYEIDFDISALPYYSNPALFTEVVKQSIKESQGLETQLSCTGGTSDAGFLARTGAEIIEGAGTKIRNHP